jgi:hypothetical protein
MKKPLVVTAVVLAAAAFAAGAFAADAGSSIGILRSHHSIEHYDMSVGVTAGQQPRRPVRFDEDREVVTVPSHYGSLVGVSNGQDATASTVLWFRDADGALRNAVVPNPAEHAYKIQMGPTSRYEFELREQ